MAGLLDTETRRLDAHSFDEAVETVEDHEKPSVSDETLLLAVLGVAFAMYFLDRGIGLLVSPLRFDENLTGWVTSAGFGDAVLRSWHFQGQSPLYFALSWVWQQIAGSSEIALRIPSLVALAAACWHLIGIGRDIGVRTAGIVASVFLVSSNVGAVDARPYMFVVLCVILSVRYGLRWATDGRIVNGILWAVMAALALYFGPFVVYPLAAQLVIGIVAARRGRAAQTVGLVALGGVLVLPLVPQILSLRARQATLVITDLPSVEDLLWAGFPPALLIALVVASIAHASPRWTDKSSNRWLVFLIAWMVLPAVGLYAQSVLTGNSTFVERYFNSSIPAVGLVAGVVFSKMKLRAAIVGCAAFVLTGAWTMHVLFVQDWSVAANTINETAEDVEVWTATGLIEAAHPLYFQDPDFQDRGANDYLSSHLLWHGADRPLLSIPIASSQELDEIHQVNVDRLTFADRSVLIVQPAAEDSPGFDGPLHAMDLLRERGYEIVETRNELGVRTTLLER